MTFPLAIGIASGGLDSLLAVEWMRRHGFEPLVLHFDIGFESGRLRALMADPQAPMQPTPALASLVSRLSCVDLRTDFLELLRHPPHGFGANLNPCRDCKITMFRAARQRMETEGAALVFSGEVLGQRPFSQTRDAFNLIERAAGLEGRLLRPLSGALLPPTQAEQAGLVQRQDLLDIRGRGRKRQTELAAAWNIVDYPTPAGGCLLTDPQYARRARDLMESRPESRLRLSDPLLLLVGRHLRLPGGGRAVIGRVEAENTVIERLASLGWLLADADFPGPTTLVEPPVSEPDLLAAARLTARYGKGRNEARTKIRVQAADGSVRELSVEPGEPTGVRIIG